jgi:mRNA interferase MazF
LVVGIKRGEIYWVDWGTGKGSEQAGLRPALIVQNDTGNAYSPNTIVASITSAANKPYPFLVKITTSESGLSKDGYADLASLATISKARLAGKAGQLTPLKMLEVDSALCVSLGIETSPTSNPLTPAPFPGR